MERADSTGDTLQRILAAKAGAVVLRGPAACGKTAAALELYRHFTKERIGGCLLLAPNAPNVNHLQDFYVLVGIRNDGEATAHQVDYGITSREKVETLSLSKGPVSYQQTVADTVEVEAAGAPSVSDWIVASLDSVLDANSLQWGLAVISPDSILKNPFLVVPVKIPAIGLAQFV